MYADGTSTEVRDVLVPTDCSECAEMAVEYATEEGIGLVVMGTHGRTGVERYLLGSVAEKTVRTSTVPVMTVRQSESE